MKENCSQRNKIHCVPGFVSSNISEIKQITDTNTNVLKVTCIKINKKDSIHLKELLLVLSENMNHEQK